ncbi:MAG TPA: tRNA lysidine(34) synthetase TilS [Campylobacterales bacterium]|nr:tRNA lysidine(34) synthetase TilS [Campylobacterales bacterium]
MHLSNLEQLKENKNLLAFSAGVDSSALFFLLLDNNIMFDIALINYGLREQSKEEERYAIELAKKYNLKVYTKKAPLFQNNFEKNARDFRYDFFDELMEEHHYTNLITAHQLNDQLEWLLMRLCKGSGASELIGLTSLSTRKEYTLVRPILHHSKEELLNYLKSNSNKYFIDDSNYDEKYERNYFRKNFSDELIKKYKNGIQKSFEYIKEDKEILMGGYEEIFNYKELYILEINNPQIRIRVIDKYLKKLGYILSSGQRSELKKEKSIVISGLWVIEVIEDKIYIAPYIKEVMPKRYKEACRIAKIPLKIRGYIYREQITPKLLVGL